MDLNSVIRRLETATLRLEEIVRSKGVGDAPSTSNSGASQPAASAAAAAGPTLGAFDDIIATQLKTFVDLSAAVGGLVADQAQHVKAAFLAQRALIELAANSKKPDLPTLQGLLAATQIEIEAIVSVREKNRASPLFNHLSAISEGIPALGWVVIEPAPAPYVAEYKEACQFYSNRVIKDSADKKEHADFVRSFGALLAELQAYVKKHHTTGLTWNAKGGDAKSFAPSNAASTQLAPQTSSTSAPAAEVKAGLFSALNKEGLTAGLRKVEKSEMTHKNPELRATSVVPSSTDPQKATPKFGGAAPKAPPKLVLEGNKWSVENYSGDSNIVVEGTELRHVVYIYNCTNSTITIKGKVNAVTIDNCKKTGVLIDSVVATVDVVNTKSSQIQITGRAPTVVVDKTDGLQLYVSKGCVEANVEILSAKSSEVNVLIEGVGEDGGYAERAVSEQIKTVIAGDRLVSSIVEHKG